MNLPQRTSENKFQENKYNQIMRDFILNKEKYTQAGKNTNKNFLKKKVLDKDLTENKRISINEFHQKKSLNDSNTDLNNLAVEIDDSDFKMEYLEE